MEQETFRFWFTIGVTVLTSILSWLLAWPQYKLAKIQIAEKRGQRSLEATEFEWGVPIWVQRAGIFVVQTGAIYLISREYVSEEPPTRASIVLIAALIGVVTICFLLPWIQSVYRVIEDRSTKK